MNFAKAKEERLSRNISLPEMVRILVNFSIERKELKAFEKGKCVSSERETHLLDLYQRVFKKFDERKADEEFRRTNPDYIRESKRKAQQFLTLTSALHLMTNNR